MTSMYLRFKRTAQDQPYNFPSGTEYLDLIQPAFKTGVPTGILLAPGGWAPRIAQRRMTLLSNLGAFEPVQEEMTVNIIGSSVSEAYRYLDTLRSMLHQADAFTAGEAVQPVLFEYVPEGATAGAILQAVVKGRAPGDQTDNFDLQPTWTEDLRAYVIRGVRIRIFRSGEWFFSAWAGRENYVNNSTFAGSTSGWVANNTSYAQISAFQDPTSKSGYVLRINKIQATSTNDKSFFGVTSAGATAGACAGRAFAFHLRVKGSAGFGATLDLVRSGGNAQRFSTSITFNGDWQDMQGTAVFDQSDTVNVADLVFALQSQTTTEVAYVTDVMVEELWHNAYSDGGFEGGTATWSASGATVTRDTTTAYLGTSSLKAVCSGSTSGQGVILPSTATYQSVQPNTAYQFQLAVKASTSVSLSFVIAEYSTGFIFQTLTTVNVGASTSWGVSNQPVTTGPDTAYILIIVRTATAVACTFWVDEVLMYASPQDPTIYSDWHPGGAELLVMPNGSATSGAINSVLGGTWRTTMQVPSPLTLSIDLFSYTGTVIPMTTVLTSNSGRIQAVNAFSLTNDGGAAATTVADTANHARGGSIKRLAMTAVLTPVKFFVSSGVGNGLATKMIIFAFLRANSGTNVVFTLRPYARIDNGIYGGSFLYGKPTTFLSSQTTPTLVNLGQVQCLYGIGGWGIEVSANGTGNLDIGELVSVASDDDTTQIITTGQTDTASGGIDTITFQYDPTYYLDPLAYVSSSIGSSYYTLPAAGDIDVTQRGDSLGVICLATDGTNWVPQGNSVDLQLTIRGFRTPAYLLPRVS